MSASEYDNLVRARADSSEGEQGEPLLQVIADALDQDEDGDHRDDPESESNPDERRARLRPARRGVGVALLGLASANRFASGQVPPIASSADELPGISLLDIALGIVDIALDAAERTSDRLNGFFAPVAGSGRAYRGSFLMSVNRAVYQAFLAATAPLAERGASFRAESEAEAVAAVAGILPETMDTVLDQVDLTGQVLTRVDLEQVVRATLESVDVFAIGREQMDPIKVATYLQENVDLAELLRTAPGGAVRGVFDTMGRMVPGPLRVDRPEHD